MGFAAQRLPAPGLKVLPGLGKASICPHRLAIYFICRDVTRRVCETDSTGPALATKGRADNIPPRTVVEFMGLHSAWAGFSVTVLKALRTGFAKSAT